MVSALNQTKTGFITISLQKFFPNNRFNKPYDLKSPLHIVARLGNLELYQYISEKVGVTNPESNGTTPLHIAANFGHLII